MKKNLGKSDFLLYCSLETIEEFQQTLENEEIIEKYRNPVFAINQYFYTQFIENQHNLLIKEYEKLKSKKEEDERKLSDVKYYEMKRKNEEQIERKYFQEKKELTRKYQIQIKEKNEKIGEILQNYNELLVKQELFQNQMGIKQRQIKQDFQRVSYQNTILHEEVHVLRMKALEMVKLEEKLKSFEEMKKYHEKNSQIFATKIKEKIRNIISFDEISKDDEKIVNKLIEKIQLLERQNKNILDEKLEKQKTINQIRKMNLQFVDEGDEFFTNNEVVKELILKVEHLKKFLKKEFQIQFEDEKKEIEKVNQSSERQDISTLVILPSKVEKELQITNDELKREIKKIENEKRFQQESKESNFGWYKSEIQRKEEIIQKIIKEFQNEIELLTREKKQSDEQIQALKNSKKSQKKEFEEKLKEFKKMIKFLKQENEEAKKIKGFITSTWKKIFGEICSYNSTIQKDSQIKQQKMKEAQELDSESEKEKSHCYIEFPSFSDDFELENSGTNQLDRQVEFMKLFRKSLHQSSSFQDEKRSDIKAKKEDSEEGQKEMKP